MTSKPTSAQSSAAVVVSPIETGNRATVSKLKVWTHIVAALGRVERLLIQGLVASYRSSALVAVIIPNADDSRPGLRGNNWNDAA